jgi:hypothetical protein
MYFCSMRYADICDVLLLVICVKIVKIIIIVKLHIQLLVTVTGSYRAKHHMHCDHFLICFASPSEF